MLNSNGASGIPTLKAVVRKAGFPHWHGILISYIEGSDLWSAVLANENMCQWDAQDLLNITYRIISVAASLEQCNFYHEDLKCSNIIRRSDGESFFIDLAGGLTEGMYRPERQSTIYETGPDAHDALFTLGRTIWELWAADSPFKGVCLARVPNETARNIIKDCEEGNLENIVCLSQKYLCTP